MLVADDFYTPEEVAARLRLSAGTIRRLLREGTLPGRKVGKRQWRIHRDDLEDYLRGGAPDAPSSHREPDD